MKKVLDLLLRIPLHGMGLFVWLLPRSWEMSLGRAFGRLLHALDFKRKPVIVENIRNCFPEMTPSERDRLVRANYEHYGILILELAHMFTPIPGHWVSYVRRHIRVPNLAAWKKTMEKGKGALFCATHLGNWEFMISSSAMTGMPVTVATRRLKPEWLHDWMRDRRLDSGTICAFQPRTMPLVLKALKSNHSVGFVMDQYMLPPMGAPLRFFGVMVSSLTALAPLARRTGAAIVLARTERNDAGEIVIHLEPEPALPEGDDAINQFLCDKVEEWIRMKPEQWLWAHRRFKGVDWSQRVPPDRKAHAA